LSNRRKKWKLAISVDEPTDYDNSNMDDLTIADDDSLTIGMDENFDLDYTNTAKLFKVSKDYEKFHKLLLSQIT